MDYANMATDALEARRQEIAAESTEDRTLEELTSLEAEMRAITDELETRKAAEEERKRLAESIATNTKIEPTNEVEPEIRKESSNMEIRNSKEYIDAFAEYIKTGRADECRSLLTENVSGGTVAVPDFVYDIVKTAWEKNEVISRVAKTNFKGNFKVNFEISGGTATKHTEGGTAVTEEELVMGLVNLIPSNYKKWIGVSDEVLDTRGEEFLRYVYEELSYRIMKKISDDLIDQIEAQAATPDATKPAVPTGSASALTAVLTARGLLSDEADGSAVVILNRTTWAAIEAARATASYAFDPFYGLPIIMSSAVANNAVIVGSLERGAILNLPNGLDVKLNFDDKTMATQDMNRVIGRLYAAIGVVAPNAFAVATIS